jgi:hypothetical protein
MSSKLFDADLTVPRQNVKRASPQRVIAAESVVWGLYRELNGISYLRLTW